MKPPLAGKASRMSSANALQIYITDHLADAVVASDFARRAADNNDGPLGTFFADLSREIEADRRILSEIATKVGVQPSAVKQAAGVVAERLGRFEIEHRTIGSAELSLLLELDLLYLGIEGKHSLWRSLGTVEDPRLAGFDFAKLAARARDQLAAVEEQRQHAAAIVLKA
jgi:predicted transcriptional regulator with HTH domain